MSDQGDSDFVYDEATGEWISASEAAAKSLAAGQVEVRDSAGNVLAEGDSVTLIKDLKVKGAGQTLKRGTVIKSIRLTGDDQEIDCRYEGIKGLVLRAEFVKKTWAQGLGGRPAGSPVRQADPGDRPALEAGAALSSFSLRRRLSEPWRAGRPPCASRRSGSSRRCWGYGRCGRVCPGP